jgi:hypothetical protein
MTTPVEIFNIAEHRISDYPGITLSGDYNGGLFSGRGFEGNYSLKPAGNDADVTLTFTKKPPVPWFIVKKYFDAQAEKWQVKI